MDEDKMIPTDSKQSAAQAEYWRVMVAAPAELKPDHDREEAWVEYDRATAAASVEYERVLADAEAELKRARAAAQAEYNRVIASLAKA